jgi:DNA repair exonuclease SbcCD ATPase subunit
MLELETISWKNFMSYGDYVTTVNLSDLGECLITGEILDDDSKEVYDAGNPIQSNKSNGAGKSTVISVIQWVLFGRTMHAANPGDKVVNYFTGKNCWAELKFKSGDKIVRTRGVGGHNELIYIKDGDEKKLTADTLSTTKAQQAQLSKDFGLDWDIFCGSVFFNQYGKPWMEMADQTRKKAIERILHVDKFMYRAKVAKDHMDAADKEVEKINSKIEMDENTIERLKKDTERIQAASDSFAGNKKERAKKVTEEAKSEKGKRDAIALPDIKKLQSKWDAVTKVDDKISAYRNKLRNTISESEILENNINNLTAQIKTWTAKSGKVCTQCQQTITEAHTNGKIDPIKEELEEKESKHKSLVAMVEKLESTIETAAAALESRKPNMTIREAQEIHKSKERHDSAFNRLKEQLKSIAGEANPHTKSLEEISEKIAACEKNIKKLKEDIEKMEYQAKHYRYIYKAYNDRTKIKSYVFQEHIPFINQRLKHYLEVFGLDVQIELTSSLGISSNMWGYEFESGGERKRTDVAFMLAIFDFHEQMYGRQCNVLVLDEVDGRLDDDGIDALINIIKNDLAPKVESVIIISHRNMMFDTFAKEMKVVRKDRFSTIEMAT